MLFSSTKKRLSLLIFILTVALTCSAADLVNVDNLSYELKNSEAYVTAPNGCVYSGDIVIPESIDYEGKTYPVVGINAGAFQNITGETSITVPKTVTSLGKNCIAGISKLKSLTFADGDAEIALSGTKSNDAPVFGCTIAEVYIGRNFKINSSSYALFKANNMSKVTFGKDITTIPSYMFAGNTLVDGLFEVSEGIEKIESKAFSVTIKHLILPSTLVYFEYNMFNFDPDFDTDIVLESRATNPVKFESAQNLITSFSEGTGFRFAKLIIPKGTSEIYEEANWFGIVADESNVEEVEMTPVDPDPDDPEPGDDDEDDESKAYVSLTVAHSSGANSYPRIAIEKGGDFTLTVDVDGGWSISSASFVYDQPASEEETPSEVLRKYAEVDEQPTTKVEKLASGTNRYKISVSGVNGNGHISYVVDKDIPTEIAQTSTSLLKPIVGVSRSEIKITSSENGSVQVYDLQGTLLRTILLRQYEAVIIPGLSTGVYILKIGNYTYKVIL